MNSKQFEPEKRYDTMGDFLKFPTTPHLLWLSNTTAREDKVLSLAEAESFLRGSVIVEEKVDGANLGISFDKHANLVVQNRGNVVARGTKGQFAPLWQWLAHRETQLFEVLGDRWILFGEWCYARHSIHYTQLPDFFLAFDIFDNRKRGFISSIRRSGIVCELRLTEVPTIAKGIFNIEEIRKLLGNSVLYDGPTEGIYLRKENPDWLIQRAKVVRPEFLQQIGTHWTKTTLVVNRLASPRLPF
jgi:hypothetical protein